METNKMFFENDDIVKVRYMGQTYEITKNEIARYLEEKPKSELSLTEQAFYNYLPFLIVVEYKGGNAGGTTMITLSPINVTMEISDKLFNFLVYKKVK